MRTLLWGAAMSLACSILPDPANAQTIFGNTPEAVEQALSRGGYDQFRIVGRSLKDVDTQACKGNRMFSVRVNLLGRLDVEGDLGRCTLGGRAAQADRPERTRRFDDGPNRPPRTGRGRAPDAADVRGKQRVASVLAQSGFRQVRVLNDRAPFDVLACDRRGRELKLSMTRTAQISSREVVGRCGRRAVRERERDAFSAADIRPLLRERGFNRIEIKRERAPYIVEACRGSRRLEIVLDADGRQQDRQRIGRCRDTVDAATLTQRLTNQGLGKVRVTQDGQRFGVRACDGATAVRIEFNRYGQEQSRRKAGDCSSRTALDILQTLRSRGAANVELKVEGCFRGTKYHWNFDQYGDRTDRERIGTC